MRWMALKMKLALLLLALCIGGCSLSKPATAPVVIDKSCSPEDRRSIREGAEEWFTAIPSARSEIVDGDGKRFNSVRCENGSPRVVDGDAIMATSTRVLMRLWLDGSSQSLKRRVIRHEFGHFLGVQSVHGHPPKGQALKHRDPTAWTCINVADIKAVCDAREDKPWDGCPGETFSNCPAKVRVARE